MYWLVIIAAAFLRIYLISRDSVPFAYDMGRDLLWTKDIVFYHTPTLIGPAASIWGVYFAPFWYYLLSIPLFLTNGHPLSAVYTTAAMIILTGLIAYRFFKKYLGKFTSIILCSIILFNSTLVNLSTFAFHANLLPLLTLLSVIFCFLAVIKNPAFITVSFFVTSLMFSADPAPAIVFTFIPIFIFFYFKLFKREKIIKKVFPSIIGYLVPLSPLLLFDLRNNFIQTKSLLAYFSGSNPSLSGQLPLLERITDRLSLYWVFYKQSFAGGQTVIAMLFLLVILVGIYKFWNEEDLTRKTLLKINLIFFILSFLIFTFLVTVEVKGWYIYGTTSIISIIIALALYSFRRQKNKLTLLLLVYLITNLLPFFKNDRIQKSQEDPAQLRNQIAAVKSIYDDSRGMSYSVYTFTPSIYDYNYQYLIWWYGVREKLGLPSDFAYLPNIPLYVRNKNFYQAVSSEQNTVYLIVENAQENEFYTKNNWISNFKDYKLIWSKQIDNAISVEKRQR